MAYGFLDTLASDGIRAAQQANNVAHMWEDFRGDRSFDRFDPRTEAFIAARDSFYLATVSQSGWPYIQHRGGPAGFLHVLDERTLGFLDFRGNRQYLTLGNLATDDRVALMLVDYPRRARLKVLGHMTVHDLAANPDLAGRLALAGYRAKAERAFTIRLTAFDWNCPQHITPRFTQAEIAAAVQPLHDRIALLEAELAAVRPGSPGPSSSQGERS